MSSPAAGAEDVGALLKHTPAWVRDQCRAGRLPHHRVGKRYVFTDADLAQILDATAVPTREPEVTTPVTQRRRRLPTYSRAGEPTGRYADRKAET